MAHRPVSLHVPRGSVARAALEEGIDALVAAAEDLPIAFPEDVLAAAQEAADWSGRAAEHDDLRDVPFVTLDPAGSTDLDQAMHLEREGEGFRVRYAIADVPVFVALDGSIDREARRRGATVYLPDRRIPLHPEVLSEGAASLLPGQDAPAFVWDLRLDARGEVQEVSLARAVVRSRGQLAYDAVQDELDAGGGHPMMQLLLEIGRLRTGLEAERGGASLTVPEQEVEGEGELVRISWRRPRAIEDANAQISLMTGMAAARLMLEGGSGILRTMPPADERSIERFRRQCAALGVDWPAGMSYGELLRTLDWREGRHLALLNQAASLFRGAGYAAFRSREEIPEDPVQSAIAAPYAHTTAPLRRLVDRFVLLVCHAHVRDEEVPPALLEVLPLIPEAMQASARRSGDLERAALDLVEAEALRAYVGEELEATVIDRREGAEERPTRVEVQLADPPVTAWVEADAQLGARLRLHLEGIDHAQRAPRLRPVPAA